MYASHALPPKVLIFTIVSNSQGRELCTFLPKNQSQWSDPASKPFTHTVLSYIGSTATVPTLVVPLETTLDPDVESRYKAIKDTKVCWILMQSPQ